MNSAPLSRILTALNRAIRSTLRTTALVLFAGSVFLTVSLSQLQPFWAQPSPPATREELIQEIQDRAAVDADNGVVLNEGRREVADDYADNPFNVSQLDIKNIYIAAYEEAKAANQPGILDRFIPEDGFVIGSLIILAGIIGAVLKDSVTQWVKGINQTINDWIYACYAGTRLFETIALRRYRTAVLETYKELRIPFRVNRPPLSMEETFVPLKVSGTEQTAEEIDAYQCISNYKRLMLKGPPGSGKSMLLKNVALSYGTGKLHALLSDRPIPVFLELHRINNPNLTADNLIQAIVDSFERHDFPNAKRFVEQSLDNGKLMLLLDGLDEVSRDVRPTVVRRIRDLLNHPKHKNCRTILTCRTAVYQGDFDGIADQSLEVVEFSDQQIRRFLESWKQEMPPEKSINQLMSTLRDRPRIMALARNPLLLTIIAYLYTDTPFVLPHSRAEFYQKSTDILLDQWQKEFNRYRAADKRRVLQHLALYNQEQSMALHQNRLLMNYESVLAELRQILTDLNLSPDSAKLILDEIVERSGLFLKVNRSGDKYQFAHLTLQEYFAAVALNDKTEELIQRFEQDPNVWREVVKLWCGLAGNSTRLIEAVYVHDPLAGFECLADAQEVDPELADRIIANFKREIGKNLGDSDAIIRAFGAVAADVRPRGLQIFHFLQKILENNQESTDRRFAAANALAMTNLPKAAQILAINYGQPNDSARAILIRMGDIAVPALEKIQAQNTYVIEAIEDLYHIGTPAAAHCLATTLMESNVTAIRYQAAWHLAALTHKPTIEDSLRRFEWSSEHRVGNRDFLWIWQPYRNEHSMGFQMLMSEIAFHLKHTPNEILDNSDWNLRLDPRLVIPLCSLCCDDALDPKFFLPKHVPESANSILELAYLDRLDSQQLALAEHLNNSLDYQSKPPVQWMEMMRGLEPLSRLDMMRRLIQLPSASQDHWYNLFRQVDFDLRTSRLYRWGILGVSFALSGAAILQMGMLLYQHYEFWLSGLLGLSIWIVILFWVFLLEGIEKPLEPSLYFHIGILGVLDFIGGVQRPAQMQVVIPKIDWLSADPFDEEFLDGVVGNAAAVGIAVAVIVLLVVVGTGTGTFAFTFSSAGAFAFTLASVVAFAFAGAFTVETFTVAGSVTGIVIGNGFITSVVAGAGAFITAVIFALTVAFASSFVTSFADAFAVADVFTDAVAIVGNYAKAVAGNGAFSDAVASADAFADAIAVAFDNAISSAYADAVADIYAFSGVERGADASAFGGTDANADSWMNFFSAGDADTETGTEARAIARAIAIAAVDAIADTVVVTSATAIATGVGLGCFLKVNTNQEKKWLYPLSFLAFPWFCWFPLTLVFSTWGVHTILSAVSPLPIEPWYQAIGLVSLLVLIAGGLGCYGYRRDRAARNPFQGGHLGRVLQSLRR